MIFMRKRGRVGELCLAARVRHSTENSRRRAMPSASGLPAPGFHHLHLNSVDPDAAIGFYVRQFPSSAKARWGGLPALAAPNNVLVLFTRVATAPPTAPQSAIWHFGWHVTDTRASLESYKTRADVT